MADKTQFELLKRAVSAWNAWRAEHADVQPDLAGANFLRRPHSAGARLSAMPGYFLPARLA